jgi:hypothetical protein
MGKVDISKAKEPHHKNYPKDKYPREGGSDLEIIDVDINKKNEIDSKSNVMNTLNNCYDKCYNVVNNSDVMTNVIIVIVVMLLIYFIYNKCKAVDGNIMEYFDGNRSKKQKRTDLQSDKSTESDWNLSEKINNLINRQNKLLSK